VASSSHLEPGEKGSINAKVYTKGRKGAISKSIKVFSNDPERPIVRLSFSAAVEE
jgi:hypothetical protein